MNKEKRRENHLDLEKLWGFEDLTYVVQLHEDKK